MAKVKIIFVGGTELIDEAIETITCGKHSHVAVLTNGYVYEASGIPDTEDPNPDKYPGLWKHRENKYDGNPYAKVIEMEVPNKEAGDIWAESMIGTPYAFGGCAIGALHDLTTLNIPGDGTLTMNCSEFATRYLRACNADILHGIYADDVTPADDEKALTA